MRLGMWPWPWLLALVIGCGGSGGGGGSGAGGTTPPPDAGQQPTPDYIPPECPAVVPNTPAATPDGGTGTNAPLDTAAQLGVFDGLVKAVTDSYLYADFGGVDWPAMAAAARARVVAGIDTEAFYAEASALVTALGDDHSYFQTPAKIGAEAAQVAGQVDLVGIGVVGKPMPEKGVLTVLSVFPGSPAEHAGIAPHDSILSIDGKPVVEDGVPHTERLRGVQCSAIALTIATPGAASRKLLLVRARVTGGVPVWSRLAPTADGARIGYVFLPTFLDSSIPTQVRQVVETWGSLDGLVLDNRMNGGGLGSVNQALLDMVTSGALGNFVSRAGQRPLTATPAPAGVSQTVPLSVLVGTDTVSYAEVFSGILQDTGRAKLVGATTMGNVETLHRYDFADGSRAWLANERFDPIVSHANWELTGIVPEVMAGADWDTFTFDTDTALAAAVTQLGH